MRGIACQQRRGIQRFGRAQLGEFAALHRVQADVLQRLQRGAQHVPLRALHAARDQAEAAVVLRSGLRPAGWSRATAARAAR